LSVHFMCDIDGTIYQTLDLKERAWHGGTSNTRSVGVEVANMGAYPVDSSPALLQQWYKRLADGRTRITVPERLGSGGVRTPNFVGYPVRSEPVYGEVQGAKYRQYDFTAEQYAALSKLTAALCGIFPNMNCDYPRDKHGQLITHAMTLKELDNYKGVLGHYHVIESKQDPGPAFQWDLLIDGAREQMRRVEAERAKEMDESGRRRMAAR
jgi:N-acetylmuramoyl-L-alanine amidase